MPKEPQKITCAVCKEIFTAKRTDAKFCSPNCRQKFVRAPEKYTAMAPPELPKEKAKVIIQDLTEPTDIKPITDAPKTTNVTIDTRQKKEIKGDSWWETYRKNKLGIK